MAEPATVYAAISAFAAVIQALKAGRDLVFDIGQKFNAEKKELLGAEETREAARILELIDPRVLDAVNDNIERAKDQLVSDLNRSVGDEVEREYVLETAGRVICNELRTIKRLNGGRLDDKRLMKMWLSYKCD